MDTNKHKITIAGQEYDTRDLSNQANRLIAVINAADSKLYKAEAELIVMQKGRESLIKELIEEVTKPEESKDD